MSIRIAKGLKSTYKNAQSFTLDEALLQIDRYSDNYEVLNSDFNRVYGDIDGKNIQGTEEEFWALDKQTREALETLLGTQPYCLMTASSYAHKKISWRFVYTGFKTTVKNNKTLINQFINKYDLGFPPGITLDTAPYGKNQKMRMLGSNKDGENRPLRLVTGEKIDTLISYVPDTCLELPILEDESEKIQIAVTNKEDNPDLLRRIVLNIKNDASTSWDEWYRVSQAIYNETKDRELFLEWSAKSPKHNHSEAAKHWDSLKDGEDIKLGAGSLFYWSKLSDPVEYQKIMAELKGPVEIRPGVPLDRWLELKEEWEKTHFYYKTTNTYAEVNPDGSIDFYDYGHAMTYFHDNFFYKLSDKYNDVEPLFPVWLDDTNKRVITSIDFAPSDDPKVFVKKLSWGFQVQDLCKDSDKAVWAFKELAAINTGRIESHTEYLLNFTSHILQKPFHCPRVAILSIGLQGAFKDYMWEFLGSKVIGALYYKDYETNDQFFAPHDCGREEKFLVKLQEADPMFCRKNGSKLKGLITSPLHSFNPKGMKEYTRKNYMRLILTTNKGNPIELEQSDRRWLPFVNTNELIDNKEKASAILKYLEAPGAGKAVAAYLLSRNLDSFDPFESRPQIDYKKNIQETEKSSEERFIEQWDGKQVGATEFYELYRDYCILNSLPYAKNAQSLGRRLDILVAIKKIKKERKPGGVVYSKG